MQYAEGKAICFIDDSGKECDGTVRSDEGLAAIQVVRTMDRKLFNIERSALLEPKGPFFAVRGRVLTTSATHSGEVGEIIATGTGPERNDGEPRRRFFKVRFDSNASEEWFSEDQVFTEDVQIRLINDL